MGIERCLRGATHLVKCALNCWWSQNILNVEVQDDHNIQQMCIQKLPQTTVNALTLKKPTALMSFANWFCFACTTFSQLVSLALCKLAMASAVAWSRVWELSIAATRHCHSKSAWKNGKQHVEATKNQGNGQMALKTASHF